MDTPPDIDKFVAEWQPVWDAMAEGRQETEAIWLTLEPDARRLGDLGWTCPDWMIPTNLLLLIRLGDERIDDFLVAAYGENNHSRFEALFASIKQNSQLERWHPILDQARDGYLHDQHLLVVPALLTVLEGLVASISGNPHRVVRVEQALRKLSASVKSSLVRFSWVAAEAFLLAVFKSHRFDAPPPVHINRHWILHGRDVPTWHAADSLRLFQGIESIAHMYSELIADPRRSFRDPSLYDQLEELRDRNGLSFPE